MAGQVVKSQVLIAVRNKRRFREDLNLDRLSAVQCRVMPRDDEYE